MIMTARSSLHHATVINFYKRVGLGTAILSKSFISRSICSTAGIEQFYYDLFRFN